MSAKSSARLLAVLAGGLLLPAAVQAADPPAAVKDIVETCASCHGKNGEGNGEFPRLAGQHSAYIVKQLTVIQSALRAAPVMHGIVKELSRDEMEAVAAYLQSR